jgi:hypothetical protein
MNLAEKIEQAFAGRQKPLNLDRWPTQARFWLEWGQFCC